MKFSDTDFMPTNSYESSRIVLKKNDVTGAALSELKMFIKRYYDVEAIKESKFSEIEIQILSLVKKGYWIGKIYKKLGITERTLSQILIKIYKKTSNNVIYSNKKKKFADLFLHLAAGRRIESFSEVFCA